MIKNQVKIIGICIAAFAVIAILYFLVLDPILSRKDDVVDNTELLAGEELGQGGRIMIVPKIEKKDMKNVVVKNKVDEYKVVHHLGYDTYYIENAELCPTNAENLSSFFVNVGYLLSMKRVAAKDIEDGNEILADLEQFGLTPEFNPVNFTVTRKDDTWYKIIIGDKIPTTGGYYVMYEDANGVRPAVYIIDTMLETTVLAGRSALLLPYVTQPIEQNEYFYIDNFKLYHGRDLFIEVYQGKIPEGSQALINYQMRHPAPYTPSTERYDEALRTFVNFVGDSVAETEITEETLLKYGFDNYCNKVTFDYKDQSYEVIFSRPDPAGNYYATAMAFNTIVEISPDKVAFLSWDLLKFIDKPIFAQNINDVAGITIKTPEKESVFTIDGTGQDIVVKGDGVTLDLPNFRQYYKASLDINLWDYEAKPENVDPMLQMIVYMDSGTVYDYKFYFSSTRNCYFSINDTGDFYVLRDKVLKLISDTVLVLDNQPIDAEAQDEFNTPAQ